jgi:hypothetical protein
VPVFVFASGERLASICDLVDEEAPPELMPLFANSPF